MASRRTAFNRACEECREMLEAYPKDREAFDGAGPQHMVALYALLHARVYGVAPCELVDTKVFLGARSAAQRMLAEEFDGRPHRMVDFMRWVWANALREERTRKPDNSFRIGWRYQFVSRRLITDYRIAQARAQRLGT